MNSFQFRQNSAIYTDLAVIQTIQWSLKPFVSHLLAEDPGLSIPSAVAILPDFDGFLPILSKLNYLDRCNRHPATKMPKSLSPTCSLRTQGPWFRNVVAILPDFDGFLPISTKLDYFYTDLAVIRPYNVRLFNPCLPPARWGPRAFHF